MIRHLFKNVVQSPRFIRIDGMPWERGHLMDHFNTPSMKVGMAVVAAASLCGLAYSPQHSAIALLMSSTYLGVAKLFMVVADDGFTRNMKAREHAIDREGRSFPPQDQTRLMIETQRLKYVGTIGLGLGLASTAVFHGNLFSYVAYNALTLNIPHPVFVEPFALVAPMVTYMAALRGRAQRLLNGTYTFCDKPPVKQRETAPSKLRGALPAPKATL